MLFQLKIMWGSVRRGRGVKIAQKVWHNILTTTWYFGLYGARIRYVLKGLTTRGVEKQSTSCQWRLWTQEKCDRKHIGKMLKNVFTIGREYWKGIAKKRCFMYMVWKNMEGMCSIVQVSDFVMKMTWIYGRRSRSLKQWPSNMGCGRGSRAIEQAGWETSQVATYQPEPVIV